MIRKILNWWKNNHSMFIRCNSDNSSIILSKKLFESIQKDNKDDNTFNVLFTKVRVSADMPIHYAMFFNPMWDNHGVENSKRIQTIPVTLGKFGHVGFQSIQPSVHEISAMYGILKDEFDIKVSKEFINGEPYYLLKR